MDFLNLRDMEKIQTTPTPIKHVIDPETRDHGCNGEDPNQSMEDTQKERLIEVKWLLHGLKCSRWLT
jgi:hypothetical protein